MPTVKVLYHAQCFDGFSSSAVFTRFYRECVDRHARFVYSGLRHGAPLPVDTTRFDADVNAIVDYRYSPSDRLHWWFDHHASAFVTDEERAHFEKAGNPQHHWGPDEPSCAGYAARTLASEHGFDPRPLAGLVSWADVIDSAAYDSAASALDYEAAAKRVGLVVEHLGDSPLATAVIDALSLGRLAEVATWHEIRKRFKPLLTHQKTALDVVREAAEVRGEVVYVDLLGQEVFANRFSSYYLFPDCTYVVVLTGGSGKAKISVGSNPWRQEARRHHVASICERHGGGGHAVVGGITIPGGDAEVGRAVARRVIEELLA